MRSNIAWTWGSESVPLRASLMRGLLQRSEIADERLEVLRLTLLQARVRRHRCRRVDQRALDRLAREASRDLREVRPRPGVAVVAHAVTAEAARRGHHVLAVLELWRGFQLDRGRRPGKRALDREERHGRDRG